MNTISNLETVSIKDIEVLWSGLRSPRFGSLGRIQLPLRLERWFSG